MSKPDGPVDAPCSDHTADGSVRAAFLREYVSVPVDAIVPLKVLRDGISESRKYAQIVSSIKAIGLVEPPVVLPAPSGDGKYYLLDGHLRIEELGSASCRERVCQYV